MSQTLLQIAWLALGLAWVALIFTAIFKIIKKSKRDKYIAGLKWITLELKIPKENLRTPQAMEQVFVSLHALGKDDFFSVEMVGFSESTHFLVRVPEHYRSLVEASMFAQYPSSEVIVSEDYIGRLGNDLPNETDDFAGAELKFEKDNPYPLRTYPSFERERGKDAEQRYLDPIATVAEVMSNLKGDEMIWLQIVLKPLADKDGLGAWKDEVKKVLDELLGRKPKEKKASLWEVLGGFLKDLILVFLNIFMPAPDGDKKDGKEDDKKEDKQGKQSYGENEVIKAVENKFSKFVFQAGVRVLYFDRRESFVKENIASVVGALRQFGAPNLNAFKLDDPKLTFIQKNFKKEQAELKNKQKLFKNYCERALPKKPLILGAEELATLYHPPHMAVGAEKLARLSMRKGGPPPDLPVVNE